jgi:hypothetical protein
VQQGRGQHGRRHAEVGQDLRDRERVGDVRLAALAALAAVAQLGDRVRPLDVTQVRLGMVRTDDPEQGLEDGDRLGAALRGEPGQALPDPGGGTGVPPPGGKPGGKPGTAVGTGLEAASSAEVGGVPTTSSGATCSVNRAPVLVACLYSV